ncbi:fimbrial protein HofM [Citrobacter koseri]|uniref:Fimbrial protein HofM n=1 Tax=Citrobacter koseri TaxID=545 RepID=A0A2X2WC01_CITKO|nr:fimbrial protein HofM [Citrobacter koseri]
MTKRQWLWATRYAWDENRYKRRPAPTVLPRPLSIAPESLTVCGAGGFEPWCAVAIRQPPVPPEGHTFAIALGLAMGAPR